MYFNYQQTMSLHLSILIVSYNSLADLRDCLNSIRRETVRISYEIVVVDNNSQDGTAEMVRRNFPDVLLIANAKNTGFSHANNQALPLARGRFIMYLNPDTLILNGAIDTMVEVMEQNQHIGLLGPHTYNAGGQTTQATVYADHRLTTVFHEQIPLFKYLLRPALVNVYFPNATCPAEVVRGSCMIARADLVRAIGGLDERYFMYQEDYALCRAVRERGFEVMYYHEASIVHSEGRSTSLSADTRSSRPALDIEQYRNLVRYFRLHRPTSSLLALRLILLAGCLWRLALFAVIAPLSASKRTKAHIHRQALLARLQWLLFDYP